MIFSNRLRKKQLTWIIVFIFIWVTPLEVFSQQTNNDADTVSRETDAEEASSMAAKKAKEKKLTENKEKVTFQEVLKDPDNIDLNMRYAQTQIDQNDLLGAASTLERVLLINPDLLQVRLFYAVVLYRLDSLEESKRELEMLKDVEMPDNVKEEIVFYLKKIKQKSKRTRVSVRQTVGWGIDDNRNAAPSSKRVLFSEVPLGLTGTERKRRDTHFINITTLDVVHDLGFQAGHNVFGSFTYFLQEQTQVDSLDIQAFQYEVGGTYKTRYLNFRPSFFASNMFLSRESFLRTQGGNLEIESQITNKFRTFANVRIERQDYLSISENTTSPERKGPRFEYKFGASYLLLPSMKWTSSIAYVNKNAEEDYNAYEGMVLSNTHMWLLGKGQFLINSLNVQFDYYNEPEVAIAGRFRKDKILRYRVTYGAPLETLLIGKILPRPFKDVTFTFSYEYYRDLSNITNYTYRNNKYQCLLTKKWEF